MAIDNDLSALLPQPPPPRPARREAAIEQALARFDAGGQQAPSHPNAARPTAVRGGWGRPQIAALASMALVVLVSVPIWWAEKDRLAPGVPPTAPPVARNGSGAAPATGSRESQASAPANQRPAQAESADPVSPGIRTTPPSAPEMTANTAPAPATLADARSTSEAPREAATELAQSLPQKAAAGRPAPSRAASEGAIVVTGSRIVRPEFDSPTPMVSVNEAVLAEGDWDTCTLLDPNRDIGACRAFADPAAPGANGRAAAQLADGLTLAWQGELDRAIEAFDRAIGAAPDLPIAYLNRGLAYQSKGDLRRALADLNRAVARDPDSARGYYHRSLLHRAKGDTKRADADAKRAIALDPAYGAVLR